MVRRIGWFFVLALLCAAVAVCGFAESADDDWENDTDWEDTEQEEDDWENDTDWEDTEPEEDEPGEYNHDPHWYKSGAGWSYLGDPADEKGTIVVPAEVDSIEVDALLFVGKDTILQVTPGSFGEAFAKKFGFQYDNGTKRVTSEGITTAEEKAKWVVDNYLTPDMTEYEKARVLKDWLAVNVNYDSDLSFTGDPLLNGYGVCMDYAFAYNQLMEAAGIESYYVRGEAREDLVAGTAFTLSHAWNYVNLCGTWYHIDTTWDNDWGEYKYFMMDDLEMVQSRFWGAGGFSQTDPTSKNTEGYRVVSGDDYVRYYDADGQPANGLRTITDPDWRYEETTGEVFRDYTTGDYLFENGLKLRGVQEVNGKKYFFDRNDGHMVKGKTVRDEDGTVYYCGEDGVLGKDITATGVKTGFLVSIENGLHNGYWRYYVDSNGEKLEGWQEIDGKKYYFQELNGFYTASNIAFEMIAGGRKPLDTLEVAYVNEEGEDVYTIKSNWYYFDQDGVMQTGLVWNDGKLQYYGEDGKQLRDCDVTVDGTTYHLDKDGNARVNIWIKTDKPHYYTHIVGDTYINGKGKTEKGPVWIDGELYYFSDDGKAESGWKTINGYLYYFDVGTGKAYGAEDPDGEEMSRYTYSAELDGKYRGDLRFDVQGRLVDKDTGVPVLADPGAHVHVLETLERKDPTCEEAGLTEGARCTVCGEIVTAQEEIPVLGHHPQTEGAYTEATCTEPGKTEKVVCGVCGKTLRESEVIPAKGHEIISDPAVEATAQHAGATEGQRCAVCGEVIRRQTNIPRADAVAAFVQRCYKLLLGREADNAGLEFWGKSLKNREQDASKIISQFMHSSEYESSAPTSESTVKALYNTMLGREPDEAGLNYWAGQLNSGASSNAIINGFCGSDEFRKICDDAGIDAGSVDEGNSSQAGEGLEGFVARCYSEALGRASDQGGMDYWSNILRSRVQTAQEVAAGFVFSQEMDARNKIANNPDALLDSLYRLYMGREADEGGKAYWKAQINAGMTLEQLNEGFAQSPEFAGIVAGYGLE